MKHTSLALHPGDHRRLRLHAANFGVRMADVLSGLLLLADMHPAAMAHTISACDSGVGEIVAEGTEAGYLDQARVDALPKRF